MEYKEALKKVQIKKEKEPFLIFNFGYDLKMVVPHKEGIALLGAMMNAEQLYDPYNEQHHISELKKDKINVTTLSREDYERYKMAKLLGLTLAEVVEAEKSNT